MKTRMGYVSNSSSSSFLVTKDVSQFLPCIKLTREIADAVIQNHSDWDGKKLPFELGTDLWLTDFVYDCDDKKWEAVKDAGGVEYMEGHGDIYSCDDNYITFKKNGDEFYIESQDIVDTNGNEVPNPAKIRDELLKILKNKSLNKSQQLGAVRHFLDNI